jgi:AhpD family alkylhydroperoxidase
VALLEPIDPAAAPDEVRETLGVVSPRVGVFRYVAHAETAFRPWLMLQHALMTKLELDPRLRELAILQVARLTGCDYERVQHEVVAVVDGVSPEQCAALAVGELDGGAFDERERLVLRFVAEVVERQRASEETAAALAGELSEREVVELLLTISHYHGLALLLNTLRVEPDPPIDPAEVIATRERRERLARA